MAEEGKGFKYIPDGLNAERTLIAAECIGDGYWFIDKVVPYVKSRNVFGRPIGQNQDVQFPTAESYIEIEAANLMRFGACRRFDARQPCGAQANMAKYLAAKASWEAGNACLQFHGGFGFANEYDVDVGDNATSGCSAASLGLSLAEAKSVLAGLQRHLVQTLKAEDITVRSGGRRVRCGDRRPARRIKGYGSCGSLFGNGSEVCSPRFEPCRCSGDPEH